jgi:hypothetical protein
MPNGHRVGEGVEFDPPTRDAPIIQSRNEGFNLSCAGAIIDDVLSAMICPDDKCFTVDELAREYGYPDVN